VNDSHVIENAEYVPTYDLPQLFRWNRYWIEIRRTKSQTSIMSPLSPGAGGLGGGLGGLGGASIFLTWVNEWVYLLVLMC